MADVAAGAKTDTGVVRDHNEDAVVISPNGAADVEGSGFLFALADGMGGHSHGEVASAEALRVLLERYYQEPVTDVALALKQAFRAANEHIYQQGAAQGSDQLMGTTLVAGVIRRSLLTIGNVGDSRAYLIRGGRAQQVSRDHSVVAEQVKAGLISADEARISRNRNVITRAVGHQPRVEVDIFDVPLLPEDTVLLVSDGLYQVVEDQEFAEMALAGTPTEAAEALVRVASERQSNDNASAVVVHFMRAAAGQTAAIGSDLFTTAELPTREMEPVGGGRGAARWLVALGVIAALVVAVLIILVLTGFLVFTPPL